MKELFVLKKYTLEISHKKTGLSKPAQSVLFFRFFYRNLSEFFEQFAQFQS